MRSPNPLNLARIKLDELRRQRDRLTAHYNDLRRGLLQESLFNRVLTGLLMTLLDVFICERSGLRTIRIGDDIPF